MADKFHKKPFDDATKLKLEIFDECFREWLPVFIFNPTVSRIFVYDFFAGKGKDSLGNPGSPLILLNEAKGDNCSFCNALNGKEIVFAFNDVNNSEKLKESVTKHLE
jgi:three-Cys-motif partner protein